MQAPLLLNGVAMVMAIMVTAITTAGTAGTSATGIGLIGIGDMAGIGGVVGNGSAYAVAVVFVLAMVLIGYGTFSDVPLAILIGAILGVGSIITVLCVLMMGGTFR